MNVAKFGLAILAQGLIIVVYARLYTTDISVWSTAGLALTQVLLAWLGSIIWRELTIISPKADS